MSTDTIDRLIEDVDKVAFLSVTGGEPLLEMDRLLYLIQSISNKWDIVALDIVTNGSILDERIIGAFEAFCSVDPKRNVLFSISKDEYHTAGAHETAMSFYKPLVQEANARLNPSDGNGITLDYHNVAERTLGYSGRAKAIIDKSKKKKKLSKALSVDEIGSHRLKIKNNSVYCNVFVTADGGITTPNGMEYSKEDANIFGYLSDDTLSNIIKRFNDANLLLCSESVLLDWENKARLLTDHMGIMEYLRIIAYAELCRVILRIRYTVQKMYGNLAAEDIIRGIQLPTSENDGHVMLALLATVSPYQDMPKALDKVDKQTRDLVKSKWNGLQKSEKDACITVIRALAYLLDPDCIGYFLRLKSRDIQKLVSRSEQYKHYGITPSNNTVFECNEEGNLLSIKYD
jgi:organic radical activating enzyme